MRKGFLGVIVGVGLMFAQSVSAADMVRYDKSANKVQPEETIAQIQMDGSCKGPHCRPCVRQCPPRHHHHHRKQCGSGHTHKHHKHSVKKQQAATQGQGHNERIEEKKMSSDRNFPAARKTSYQGNNDNTYVEEYIDEVGREHR